MPDIGRFSYPFTSTLPNSFEPPCTAKDVESLMWWLNREATTHDWPPFVWKRHNGTSLETFTPQNAIPYGLQGKPWHIKEVWKQIRDNYGLIGGPYLFQDYLTYAPYALNGNTPYPWNPNDPTTYGTNGKMRLSPDALGLINNIPASGPGWNFAQLTKNGPTATASEATGEFVIYPNDPTGVGGSGENWLIGPGVAVGSAGLNYDSLGDVPNVSAACGSAWSAFQGTPLTVNLSLPSPDTLNFTQQVNYVVTLTNFAQDNPLAVAPPFENGKFTVNTTVNYSLTFSVAWRYIGSGSLQNCIGMVPLLSGKLPFALLGTWGSTYFGQSFNPWGNSMTIAFGTVTGGTDNSLATTKAIAEAIAADLPGSSMYALPEPSVIAALMNSGNGYTPISSAYNALNGTQSFSGSSLADFTPAHTAKGGNYLWVAIVSSDPWNGGQPAAPSLAWPPSGEDGATEHSNWGTETQASEIFSFSTGQLTSSGLTGYPIGSYGPFIQSLTSGALGIALPWFSST